jgi:hypothetical protein
MALRAWPLQRGERLGGARRVRGPLAKRLDSIAARARMEGWICPANGECRRLARRHTRPTRRLSAHLLLGFHPRSWHHRVSDEWKVMSDLPAEPQSRSISFPRSVRFGVTRARKLSRRQACRRLNQRKPKRATESWTWMMMIIAERCSGGRPASRRRDQVTVA